MIPSDGSASADYLPPSHVRVLLAVYQCRLHGQSPTSRRIAGMLGHSGHAYTHRIMTELSDLGFLDMEEGKMSTTITTHCLLLTPESKVGMKR